MVYKTLLLLILLAGTVFAVSNCVYNDKVYDCVPTTECASRTGIARDGCVSTNFNDPEVCCDTGFVTSVTPTTTAQSVDSCTGLPTNFRTGFNNYGSIIESAVASSGLSSKTPNAVALIAAMISQESYWDPAAKSQCGSVGISQFTPGTGRNYGLQIPDYTFEWCPSESSTTCYLNGKKTKVSTCNSCSQRCDPTDERLDPQKAIPAMARLMADLIDQCGSVDAAVQAYNSGTCGVEANAGYLTKVNGYLGKWESCLGNTPARPTDTDTPTSTGNYGACDAPWTSYTCQKLNTVGNCPNDGYSPLPGMCPKYANDVQCCIEDSALESNDNPYGNCRGIFSDYDCERVTRQGNAYVCSEQGYEPVAGFCPGASFVECCVPTEIRQEKMDSGDYTKCQWPLDQYDCTTPEYCEETGEVSYGSDFCTKDTVCCVPKNAFVQKKYVYDNANVIDAAIEKQINSILGSMDDEQQLADRQIKMPIIIQTEKDNANVNDDFVRKRYQELFLDKTFPSAIIVLKIRPATENADAASGDSTPEANSAAAPAASPAAPAASIDTGTSSNSWSITQAAVAENYQSNTNALVFQNDQTGSKEIKRYSASKDMNRALYYLIFQNPTTANYLDNGRFSEGFLNLANDLKKYDLAYSKIVDARERVLKDESCDSFANYAQTIADSFDLPDNLKTDLKDDLRSITTEACATMFETAVKNELQDEMSKLDLAIQNTRTESDFDTENPTCEPAQAGKYACVAYPDGGYDVRQCVNTKTYADTTTVSIAPGSICLGAQPGTDDYFDLTNGQVRCVKDANGYTLAQCRNSLVSSDGWTQISNNYYDSQDACAVVCKNNPYCTEPKLNSYATDTNGNIIGNGQSVPLGYIKLVSNNDNLQSNSDKLDRDVYHAIKYRFVVNDRPYPIQSVDCPNNYCEVWIKSSDIGPGYTIQYWTEESFLETNGKTTYIRSPATDVKTVKIYGQATPAAVPTGSTETFFNWQSKSDKFSDMASCSQACSGFGDCLNPSDGIPVDAGTTNIIKTLRGNIKESDLQNEKNEIQNILGCYSGSTDFFETCLNKQETMTTLSAKTGGETSCKARGTCPIFSNARMLMLRNLENSFDDYSKNPAAANCYAAWDAAQEIVQVTSEKQKIINAYNLVIDKCSKVKASDETNTITTEMPVQNGGDRTMALLHVKDAGIAIRGAHDSFTTGVVNVAESFGEPVNLAVLGGTITLTAVTSAFPVASVVTASRIASGTRLIAAGVEAYFGYKMASGLGTSIVMCAEAGISSDKCGEATTQAVMVFMLAKSFKGNTQAGVELFSGSFRLENIKATRAEMQQELNDLDNALTAKETEIITEKTRLQGQMYASKAELDALEAKQAEVADLKQQVETSKQNLDKTTDEALVLLDKMIEQGNLVQRTGKSRTQIMQEEFGKVIEKEKSEGKLISCAITGGATGVPGCSSNSYQEEVLRQMRDGLKKTSDITKITRGETTASMTAAELNDISSVMTDSDLAAMTKSLEDAGMPKSVSDTFASEWRKLTNDVQSEATPDAKLIKAASGLDTLIQEMKVIEAPADVVAKLESLSEDVSFRASLGEIALDQPVAARPKIDSDRISETSKQITRINEIKNTLIGQKYQDGSGTHVTPLENAIGIAEENALQPSELSGQVDCYVKQPGQPINLVNYGGSTKPVVIEIPSIPGTRTITTKGSGGIAGKAVEEGKSYVTVDDARFHTVDGPPEGYSRQEFLDKYGKSQNLEIGLSDVF